MFPIIDCHCHIYPSKIAEKAVIGIGNFYHIDMVYDGRLETLEKENQGRQILSFFQNFPLRTADTEKTEKLFSFPYKHVPLRQESSMYK